ncbi:ribosomal protein L1/ribosomal biogenesis protein [Scheffersomyces coipomensis]|uniref:ribosomal protein L1/ribosomal biogenesis protein n=1 Tax=Scheffersomyces coipomensis TaxID=1788519 RepID=UPI00315D95A6
MSSEFILGEEAFKNGSKSLKSLINQTAKTSTTPQAIYVSINIKIKLTSKNDYIPRIIPLKYKLDKVENKSILLITKDPSTPYRHALTEKDSPTEDVFNQIFTLTKLKSLCKNKKDLTLFKEYDLIVADHRVHKFLPQILNEKFYIKNKKLPYMIQMAKPTPKSQSTLTASKKNSTKLKDDRCEPKYVYHQMKSIVGNTSYVPKSNGNCLFIKVGYTDWNTTQLLSNVNDVISYLTDLKHAPVGGVLKSVDNLGNIHVKTSESISLPVYIIANVDDKNDDDDGDNSDYDF